MATYSECSRFFKSAAGARSSATVTIKGETSRRGAAPAEAGRKWNAPTQVYQKLLPLITGTFIYKPRSKTKYRKKSRECSHRTTRCITLVTSKQPDVQRYVTVKFNTPEARQRRGEGSVFMPQLHRHTHTQHYSHLKYGTRLPPPCKGEGTWWTGRVRPTELRIKTGLCLQRTGVSMTTSQKASAYSPRACLLKVPTSRTPQWAKGFVK